ncbi:Ldh family oxidoreductase [Pseudactinotalea sp. Z1739]|uniref:Ldh family oxidoreductase n=1 Tax=Pseudactinotalea sp. Z1739 TaxID=3413028 RepID=UPI003C7A6BA5
MTSDTGTETDVAIPAPALHEAVFRVLVAEGASQVDAQKQATVLVEGDLRGHHSHGVRRLAVLVGRLRNGLIKSPVEPDARWVTDSFLRVDGRCGFGPVVAHNVVDQIVERSSRTGIAIAAVSNANHVGMLAPYVEQIAGCEQIGIALTSSEALVHPWGSAKPMIGTNPIAIAVPTSGEPMVLDMATAAVSMGKVLDHSEKSLPIPLGWAVDREGVPTTNPSEVLDGALSPFGGPKGYALGIALEVFLGALSGTSFGADKLGTLDTTNPVTKGDVFIAISLDRVGLIPQLAHVNDYLNEVRASASYDTQVTVPGDRARATRKARMEHGIPVSQDLWNEIGNLLEAR